MLFRSDFASDWAALKPRMADPNQRQMAIAELLSILRYVDTYNYAPDSPPWMATEEGRANARESAVEILHELGSKAAEKVWEALADDIRFDTAESRKALHKVHVERDKVQGIENDLRVHLSKKFPKVFELIDVPPPKSDPDNELMHAWSAQVWRLGLLEMPRQQIPEIPSPDGKVHRRVPQRMVQQIMPALLPNVFQAVQVDPNTVRDPAVQTFIKRHGVAQAGLLAAMGEYNRVVGKLIKPQFGLGQVVYKSGDLVPCEEYRGDLETVLARTGKDALPVLERGARHTHKDVAAKAGQLIQAIKAQEKPFQSAGLLKGSKERVRLAGVALEVWDLGDPRAVSPIAARALVDLKARGIEMYADLFVLHRSKKLDVQREVINALEKLSGEKLGQDLAAWVDWHEKSLEAERNKPLPKELSPEDLVIAPTCPASKDETPKKKIEAAVEPPPEAAEEEAKPGLLDRLIKKPESSATPPEQPAPAKAEPKKTELEDEKPAHP